MSELELRGMTIKADLTEVADAICEEGTEIAIPFLRYLCSMHPDEQFREQGYQLFCKATGRTPQGKDKGNA